MPKLTVDLVTEDPNKKEWVLYLVEAGPWDTDTLENRLQALQERVYDAIDVAVDGHLASKFSDSKGKKVRIQIDCHDNPPKEVNVFLARIARYIERNQEYQDAIKGSVFIRGLRIVGRSQMGRGESSRKRRSER